MNEWDRLLLPLRIAAVLFIIQGAVPLAGALLGQLRQTEMGGFLDAFSGGLRLVQAVEGTVFLAIGIGILFGKRLWRTVGAVSSGLALGWGLATVPFGYWPLGAAAWDWGLTARLVTLAVLGLQFWAVTNSVARSYCSE